jgi:hypothetical protein
MIRGIRRHPLAFPLCANAAVLVGILVVLLGHASGPAVLPGALAQVGPVPVAGQGGASGLLLMPAQFHRETWGCYVLDQDNQILTAYQYIPGRRALELVASRDISHDRSLKDFNTFPSPLEIKAMVEKERDTGRVAAPAPQDPPVKQ